MTSHIISTEAEINNITQKFCNAAFADKDGRPELAPASRSVRTKDKDADKKPIYKTVTYHRPVRKLNAIGYAAALALALSEVKTQRIEKQADGTEKKTDSNLLADQIEGNFDDIAEDAYETFGSKGDGPGYFRSFIVGVRSNRDTEKSLTLKITAVQKEALELIMAINSGDWSQDKTDLFGVSDKAAANIKSSGLLQSYAQLKAKLEAIIDAKTKRELAKEAKAA